MKVTRKHRLSHTPRFPAFRSGNGNRDAQRVDAELAAMRAHRTR